MKIISTAHAFSPTRIGLMKLMSRYFHALKKYDAEMFWAAEKFNEKTGFHIHALIDVPNESAKVKAMGVKYYSDLWQKISGGRNRSLITVFDKSKKASEYITKEILDGSTNWEIL